MRRRLLLFLPFVARAGQPASDDFLERVLKFNLHWNRFARTFLGCPKGATELGDCRLKDGAIDYGEFNKARREAEKLFDF